MCDGVLRNRQGKLRCLVSRLCAKRRPLCSIQAPSTLCSRCDLSQLTPLDAAATQRGGSEKRRGNAPILHQLRTVYVGDQHTKALFITLIYIYQSA